MFLRSKKHLIYIRELPCIISGYTPCDPAHLSFGIGGMGLKSPDTFVVPLKHELHQLQHGMGEISFWKKFDVNPFVHAYKICKDSPCKRVRENYKKIFKLFSKRNYLIK